MTPAARVAAAIDVLDDILAGQSPERALSNWARASRFAGSKDRAALRDLVFDALRRRASCAALGGGLNSRGLMLGLGAQQGWAMPEVFSGDRHAPAALTVAERDLLQSQPEMTEAVALDLPAWQWARLQDDLGPPAHSAAATLRDRAGLFLRVNRRKATPEDAIAALAADEITAIPHPAQQGCLRVTTNPRRVSRATAYLDGTVEIQDAASQIAIARLNIPSGARVLDYCAGGGGKALALADRFDCHVTAHDVAPARMKDIAPRAARADVKISVAQSHELKKLPAFDVILVDAPCSGSGTWRRNPQAKWALTPTDLAQFAQTQQNVMQSAAAHLKQGGNLIYMTCSIFAAENVQVVEAFCAASGFAPIGPVLSLLPTADHDGFYSQTVRLV